MRSGASSHRTVIYWAPKPMALTPRCRAGNRLTDPITMVLGPRVRTVLPLHDPRLVPTATSTLDFLADRSASSMAHSETPGISPSTVNVTP